MTLYSEIWGETEQHGTMMDTHTFRVLILAADELEARGQSYS